MELIILRELRDKLLAENELLRAVERAARDVAGEVVGYERESYGWDKWGCDEYMAAFEKAIARLDAHRKGE